MAPSSRYLAAIATLLLIAPACGFGSGRSSVPGFLKSDSFTNDGNDTFNNGGYTLDAPLAVGASVTLHSVNYDELDSSNPEVLEVQRHSLFTAHSPGRAAVFSIDDYLPELPMHEPVLVPAIPSRIIDYLWVYTERVSALVLKSAGVNGISYVPPRSVLSFIPPPHEDGMSDSAALELELRFAPQSAVGAELQLGDSSLICDAGSAQGHLLSLPLPNVDALTITCSFDEATSSITLQHYPAPGEEPLAITVSETFDAQTDLNLFTLQAHLPATAPSLLWVPWRWTIETPDTLHTVDYYSSSSSPYTPIRNKEPSFCDNHAACRFHKLAPGRQKVTVELAGTAASYEVLP